MHIGTVGSTNSDLNEPVDIAFDSATSTIYIADSQNHRIMAYSSGASAGSVAAGGNGMGTATNQLHTPCSVYFDSTNNSLIVANCGAYNIVRWPIGGSSWTLVAGVTGIFGTSALHLFVPCDITLDSFGNLYVADTANHRIQFFRAGESNGTTIAGMTSTPGSANNRLDTPYGLAIDSQLNVYVVDNKNYRIQKFQRY